MIYNNGLGNIAAMKYWVINVSTTQWNRSHFSLRRGSICFADVIAKVVALFPQYFLVDSPAVVWTGGLSRSPAITDQAEVQEIILSWFYNVIAGYLTSDIFM